PVLHLDQLLLEPAELLLVDLPGELARPILGVAMPAVLGCVPGPALALGSGRHRALRTTHHPTWAHRAWPRLGPSWLPAGRSRSRRPSPSCWRGGAGRAR